VTLTVDKVCSVWTGISWADEDTDETILDVKMNNAKRDAFCKGIR